MEIGFGDGDHIINMALQFPNINFLGIELYKKGVCIVLKKIHLFKITNVRIVYKNAYNILTKIKYESFYGVHILFPDPWGKIKHYKRRLLNKSFTKIILLILINKGYIHICTDIKEYSKIISTYFLKEHAKFIQFKSINKSFISKCTKFQRKNNLKKYYEIIFQKK